MMRGPAGLSLAMAGGAVVVLGAGLALEAVAPEMSWHQPALHSAVEAVGGLAAVAMALVLFQRRVEPGGGTAAPLALGFLGMGLLEEFHAVAQAGNGFILLRGAASLIGGLGFVLVWVPAAGSVSRRAVWGVVAGAAAFGLWVLASPDSLPAMTRNGRFTPTAVVPTSLACLLFLAASLRLLSEYGKSGSPDDALLACLSLLYGLAEFMFMYSSLWDGRWWFWHGLRLLASLLVLGFIGRGYLRTVGDLHRALAQTRLAEETLRASGSELRRLFEARERMAQDLHDGIIQSLYAQVLGLERCRRLLRADPAEAGRQLEDATAGLTLAIRELRGHIQGLESRVTSGAELEAALALLERTLGSGPGFRLALRVDRAAADRLTPDQAAHLLYVAREALSNSLRHGRAGAATIAIEGDEGMVRLLVEDDGSGFDPSAPEARGEGLKNMAARARKLGAHLTVASEPGRGTCVRVEVPMERAHAAP